MALIYYVFPRDSCIFFGYLIKTNEKSVEGGDYVLHLDFLLEGSASDREDITTTLYWKSCAGDL